MPLSRSEGANVIEEPEPGIVRLMAAGLGESTAGPGGWGALLRYGDHARELSGHAQETTGELMTFTAVVEGLERLTRPVRVRVWCGGEGVPRPGTEPERVPDADLYRRLMAMAGTHRIEWAEEFGDLAEDDEDDAYFIDPFEDLEDDHPYERLQDLAYDALVEAEALARDGVEPAGRAKTSLEEALRRFLSGERARLPRRDFEAVEDVVGILRFSIGWYGDEKPGTVRASSIADHLPDFCYVVVHKRFASPAELETIREVMHALLDHLRDTGQIGAGTAKSLAGELTERFGGFTAVRTFVNALKDHIEDEAPDVDHGELASEDWIADQYAEIVKITEGSITFREDGLDTEIGPISLPPRICAMAKPGWRILLTAARLDGRWTLLQAVNGDA
ncbi:hypothetical protein [Actinocorallia longicatena]|uniref:RNase H type-1 domain-containing protein n=1 Tax=Actinocorallia longicatena TaxID=111803 RepID=A0ABP6QDK6_9ACTN